MVEHIKMKPAEYLNALVAIRNFGKLYDLPILAARVAFQQIIDDAWERAWQPGNLQAQMNWQQLFPADRRPTVEEYIVTIAREQQAGREPPYLL